LTTSSLGPSLSATLVTPNLDRTTRAYCDFLHHHVHSSGTISAEQAFQWKLESMAGASMVWLANELEEPWLRVIEQADADVPDPFWHSGWFSLEVGVKEVDSLREGLDDSPFSIIGEPANLDVSDDIRAMQLVGPSGELLYLTQVNAKVPPFDLPFARCAVDRLFIPVLLSPDRDSSLATYEQFPGTSGMKFETKITVINQARKLDIDQRHLVSTIQLRGKHLIEIDQLDGLSMRPASPGSLPTGIGMITFAVNTIPTDADSYTMTEGVFAGHKATLMRGAAGELIELIETDIF
jgi:hypothetical protein